MILVFFLMCCVCFINVFLIEKMRDCGKNIKEINNRFYIKVNSELKSFEEIYLFLKLDWLKKIYS